MVLRGSVTHFYKSLDPGILPNYIHFVLTKIMIAALIQYALLHFRSQSAGKSCWTSRHLPFFCPLREYVTVLPEQMPAARAAQQNRSGNSPAGYITCPSRAATHTGKPADPSLLLCRGTDCDKNTEVGYAGLSPLRTSVMISHQFYLPKANNILQGWYVAKADV